MNSFRRKKTNYGFDKENIFGLKNIRMKKPGTVTREEVVKTVITFKETNIYYKKKNEKYILLR